MRKKKKSTNDHKRNRILFTLLLCLIYSNVNAQNLEFPSSWISFNIKKMVFSEGVLGGYYFKDKSQYDDHWDFCDTTFRIEEVNYQGFNSIYSTVKVTFYKCLYHYNKGRKFPAGPITSYLFNLSYIVAVLEDHGASRIYRLSGFLENDFNVFIDNCIKTDAFYPKIIKRRKYLTKNFTIEGIDIECQYDNFIRKKKRNCYIPNKVKYSHVSM